VSPFRTLITIIVTSSVILQVHPSSVSAGVLAANGRIAFYKFNGHPDQIYSIADDGTDRAKLTESSRAPNWDPAWSPDGTQIAFARFRAAGGTRLMVMGADGSDPTVVLLWERELGAPDWSPDGTQIAFCGLGRHFVYHVYVVSADGSDPTRVGPAGACDPVWSPDGSQIAFADFDENFNSDLWLMNPDGGGLVQLTTDQRSLWPTWSPDGARISFIRRVGTGNNKDLFVIDADGTDRVRLTDTRRVEYTPDWSPDGSLIVFGRTVQRSAFSPNDLWTITPDGFVATRLTETPRFDEFRPDWQAI
jgi:TolB protein